MTAAYPRLARAAVARALAGERDPEFPDPEAARWRIRRACFVSLKTAAGRLRGCIGSLKPTQENIGLEIIVNARSAAFRDPRFPPLTQAELPEVFFSIDVLSDLEPVEDWSELDPARWGIVVSRGGRRGLLLPDLPGVDSVDRQIALAAEKAGLRDLKNITLQRFSVERHPETAERP